MQFAQNVVNQTQNKTSQLAEIRKSAESLGSATSQLSLSIPAVGIFVLESNLLSKIFSLFNIKQRLALRRVCRAFSNILLNEEYELFKYVDLNPWHKVINDQILENILNYCGPNIFTLSLKCCWLVTNKGIKSIYSHAPALIELNLHSVWEMTDDGLSSLAQVCLYLECIDLSNCRKISSRGMIELLKNARNLQYITLSYCKSLTDDIMGCEVWSQMKTVNFQRCTGIFDAGFKKWSQLASTPIQQSISVITETPMSHGTVTLSPTSSLYFPLEELNLSDCSFLSDETIKVIAKKCPQLKRLCLSFCCSLTDAFVEALTEGCPFIQTLDCSYCGNAITDDSLSVLAQGLPKLRSLNIRGCVQVTDHGIKLLAEHAKQLETINFTQCKFVSPTIAKDLKVDWNSSNQPLFEERTKPIRAFTG